MEKEEIQLRIISPAQLEYEGNVSMVVIPGEEGELGILPHHMPLITSLKEGEIKIYKEGIMAQTIKIISGVASVSSKGVDVLLSSV